MRNFYIFILTTIIGYSQTAAQKSSIFYVKDSSSNIKVDDGYKTIFAFSKPGNYDVSEAMQITLSLKGVSINITGKAITPEKGNKMVTGELPEKLFDSKKEGHITFGKAMLAELDSAGEDSIIIINTCATDAKEIKGELKLDFKGCCKTSKIFWYEIEYYILLSKQGPIQDSIKKVTADIQREKALEAASQKYLDVLNQQAEEGNADIELNYNSFKMKFKSLGKINQNIDNSFSVTKTGEQLTEEQKKEIAYMTGDASKLKEEIKKEPRGKEALTAFEKVARANSQYNSSKRQHDLIVRQVKASETKLDWFKKESKRIRRRILSLKKVLKL
jgi:hypothetical protein